MNDRKSLFLIALLIVILLVAAGIGLLSKPVLRAELYEGPLKLDADRAYENIRELCEGFPRRSIFREDNRLAAEWLQERLWELDMEIGILEFDSWVENTRITGMKNIYGISRGSVYPDEIIIVTSHYDIPDFVYQGAADAGSDVGIIMELARLFSGEKHRRTMMFLLTNNEEYALQGAYNFVQRYADIDKVVAVLAMDYMNMGEYDYTLVRFEGTATGYTPLWLREIAVEAAARSGAVEYADPFMEWVQRAVTIASTDTGMFLAAGIPAVNITTRATDLEWQRMIYHSEEDTMEHIRPETVAIYGQTAELILRSLDEMQAIPSESMLYYKYNGRYLPGWLINALQLLVFMPLFLILAFDFGKVKNNLQRVLRKSGLRTLFLFISGFAGYLVLLVLPLTELMVRYELYPATQKDPVLYNPQYIPVGIFLFTMVATGVIIFKLLKPRLYLSANNDENDKKDIFMASRWLMLCLLAVLILVTWAEGSGFAGTIFLFLPAYLWPWIVYPSSGVKKVLNLFLLIAGSAVFLVFIYIFATTYQVGVIWWYMLLAAAFGMFSIKAVTVFLWAVSLLLAMFPVALRGE